MVIPLFQFAGAGCRTTARVFAKSWMNSDSGSSDDGSNKKPLFRKTVKKSKNYLFFTQFMLAVSVIWDKV